MDTLACINIFLLYIRGENEVIVQAAGEVEMQINVIFMMFLLSS